jgi:hypothetical protein
VLLSGLFLALGFSRLYLLPNHGINKSPFSCTAIQNFMWERSVVDERVVANRGVDLHRIFEQKLSRVD